MGKARKGFPRVPRYSRTRSGGEKRGTGKKKAEREKKASLNTTLVGKKEKPKEFLLFSKAGWLTFAIKYTHPKRTFAKTANPSASGLKTELFFLLFLLDFKKKTFAKITQITQTHPS